MSETMTLSIKSQFFSHFDNLDFSFDEKFSSEKRDRAKNALDNLEFPTSKTEYWKYTRINKIIKGNYKVSFPENEVEIDIAIPSKNSPAEPNW